MTKERARRPSPICDDRFTKTLRDAGFQVLAAPGNYDPLTVFALRRNRYIELGSIAHVVTARVAPPRPEREDEGEFEGLTTGRLKPDLANVALAHIAADLAALLGGRKASRVVLQVERVSRVEVSTVALSRYLAKAQGFRPHVATTQLAIVTGALAAQRMTLHVVDRSTEVTLAAVKNALRGSNIRVRAREELLILEADQPWTFAVRLANLVETENGIEHRPRRVASTRGPIETERALRLGRTPSFGASSSGRRESVPSLLGGAEPRARPAWGRPPRAKAARAPVRARPPLPSPSAVAEKGLPAASAEAVWIKTERRVGVGFVPDEAPSIELPHSQALVTGQSYWLWCAIGANVGGAIGGGVPLADSTPEEADLDVVVLSSADSFAVEHESGTLRLRGDRAEVLRAAGKPTLGGAQPRERLYFRVRAPSTPGRHRLCLQLYCRGLLVQALDVATTVADSNAASDPMECSVTYALSRELLPKDVGAFGAHSLSVAVQEEPSGSHVFSFFAPGTNEPKVVASVSLDSATAQSLLDMARATLREVAWGAKAPFDPNNHTYRYSQNGPLPKFSEDLARLAKTGRRLWSRLIKDFSGGPAGFAALEKQVAKPGVIQLGLKSGSTMLVPLALIYDHPLEPDLQKLDGYSLCPVFAKGELTCFDAGCPHRLERLVVCPSGFWGFRHSIGVPIGTDRPVDAVALVESGRLRLLTSVYAGQFDLRDAHLAAIEKLVSEGAHDTQKTRDGTMKALADNDFQLLYFYCHGGVDDGVPFLRVGADTEDPNRISPAALDDLERWITPRALVVINGCHTTAIEPAQALDLVGAFVDRVGASGVVGTEITVFEPLAVAMGERLIAALLSGAEVGNAVRNARRQLLFGDRPNPLGLAYLTFSLATLKLEAPTPTTT